MINSFHFLHSEIYMYIYIYIYVSKEIAYIHSIFQALPRMVDHAERQCCWFGLPVHYKTGSIDATLPCYYMVCLGRKSAFL